MIRSRITRTLAKARSLLHTIDDKACRFLIERRFPHLRPALDSEGYVGRVTFSIDDHLYSMMLNIPPAFVTDAIRRDWLLLMSGAVKHYFLTESGTYGGQQ